MGYTPRVQAVCCGLKRGRACRLAVRKQQKRECTQLGECVVCALQGLSGCAEQVWEGSKVMQQDQQMAQVDYICITCAYSACIYSSKSLPSRLPAVQVLRLFLYFVAGKCHANAVLSTAHHMSRSLVHCECSQLMASLQLRSCVLGVLTPWGLTVALDTV